MSITVINMTAWATKEGAEMLVLREELDDPGTDDEISFGSNVVSRRPLSFDRDKLNDLCAFADDLDDVLATMGFRRTEHWRSTPTGPFTRIERA